MAPRTAPNSPRAPEVLLGLPEPPETSYTYEKVRLGRFGSAEALESVQNATLRFRPLETPKNVVHVCQNAKVTFCKNIIFWKNENKVTKSHFCVLAYVSDVFGCPEGSKRSKSLKWRRWRSFRSKMTQAALWHTCPTFFDVFGVPKRVFALKTRFGATFALRDPKTIKKRRSRMTKK